ncbi:type 2 periplasmic-binding domain-containing protein [Xanthobacter pseudotagetidis]|uniref:hypothetical protein n=1 Tax=Xanthobacter pseudotagetidis TaxID=3119911 RepID=UPI0037274721
METITTTKDVCARSRLYTILPTYAVADEVTRGLLSVSRIVRPEIRRLMAGGTWPTSIGS